MVNPKNYLQRKATEKALDHIPTPLLDAVGRAMLKGVDKAVETRWERAIQRAADAEGDSLDDRIRSVSRSLSREMASLGAATGATAAAPVVGTAGAISVLVADIGWFAVRSADFVMTVGALHGRLDATPEERRAWVLSILAFGEEAAQEFLLLAGATNQSTVVAGERVGTVIAGALGGDMATVDALRRINTTLAAKVVTKYGSRKGILSIGKLLPFGIGALVGGSANWALARALSHQSRRFFQQYRLPLPPPPTGPPLPPPLPPSHPAPAP